MSGTVWDQEFFRRRAAGEQKAGHVQEPTGATPLTPGHATIAELLLARAGDDNTALLFEDQRWSWRELVLQAATRSALMQQLRPQEGPWHVGVLLENTPQVPRDLLQLRRPVTGLRTGPAGAPGRGR